MIRLLIINERVSNFLPFFFCLILFYYKLFNYWDIDETFYNYKNSNKIWVSFVIWLSVKFYVVKSLSTFFILFLDCYWDHFQNFIKITNK